MPPDDPQITPLEVFLDANAIIHALPPHVVDWHSALDQPKTREIRVLVPRTVLNEVEKKKYGTSERMQRRCADRSRQIGQAHRERTASQNGVTVRVLTRTPPMPAGLDADDGDDRLVAAVLAHRDESTAEIVVVSNDMGLSLLAEEYDIPVRELHADARLPLGPSPEQETIRALREELASTADGAPAVIIDGPRDEHARVVVECAAVTLDVDAVRSAVHERFPRIESHAGRPSPTLGRMLLGLSTDQANRYNAELDEFYEKWNAHLAEVQVYAAKLGRTARVSLQLRNDGRAPAEGIVVRLRPALPTSTAITTTQPRTPKAPRPPTMPKPLSAMSYGGFDSRILGSLRPYAPRVIEPIDFTIPDVEVGAEGDWPVTISLRRLKHHLTRDVPEVLLALEDEPPDLFRIDYEVLLDNRPDKEQGSLNMVVERTPVDLTSWLLEKQLSEDRDDDDDASSDEE